MQIISDYKYFISSAILQGFVLFILFCFVLFLQSLYGSLYGRSEDRKSALN